jgi:hypothetical protein
MEKSISTSPISKWKGSPMKSRSINLVWGLAMVAAGLVWTAQNLGWIADFSPQVWIGTFAVMSLLFFASYLINGRDQWGWLFPALISAGLAVTISMAEAGISDPLVGAPIFLAIGTPFVVTYLQDRTRWWALIPAWVMAVLVLVLALAERASGELVGTVVLWGIALPFVVVYLQDRTKWWALIPAGIMGALGFVPLLTLTVSENWIGPMVMLLFGLVFGVVYLLSPKNWWAVIPAGHFATIGLVVLAVDTLSNDFSGTSRVAGLLFLGWGLTFLGLWLRRASAPVEWAKYPAGILLVFGLIALVVGADVLQYLWPIAIIGAGVVVLWRSLVLRRV